MRRPQPHVWRQFLGAGCDSASLGHRNQSCTFPRNSHSQAFPAVSGGGIYLQPRAEMGSLRIRLFGFSPFPEVSPGIVSKRNNPPLPPFLRVMGSSGRHLSACFPWKYPSAGKAVAQSPSRASHLILVCSLFCQVWHHSTSSNKPS